MFVIAISLAATAMERQEKRLAKYSRYNASQKGRERVERYRATGPGLLMRQKQSLRAASASHQDALAVYREMYPDIFEDVFGPQTPNEEETIR